MQYKKQNKTRDKCKQRRLYLNSKTSITRLTRCCGGIFPLWPYVDYGGFPALVFPGSASTSTLLKSLLTLFCCRGPFSLSAHVQQNSPLHHKGPYLKAECCSSVRGDRFVIAMIGCVRGEKYAEHQRYEIEFFRPFYVCVWKLFKRHRWREKEMHAKLSLSVDCD